jgi:predicted RNA binding protein YcfA (HicA-like mRNA interferase family)
MDGMRRPVLSGNEMVRLLSKAGFSALGHQGSHVILLKNIDGRKLKPVVPLHRELHIGTLLSIIKQAGMTREQFMEIYKKNR